jgi:hypothetical protein
VLLAGEQAPLADGLIHIFGEGERIAISLAQ